MMAKHPAHHHSGPPDYEHAKPGTVAWYFQEFWPVMIFGTCFVLMMVVPLSLSGVFGKSDFYSQGAHVWAPYGLLILGAFVAAWLITFLLPRFVGIFVFLVGVYSLISVEGWSATHWGKSIAVLFLAFVLFGNIFMYMVTRHRYPIDRTEK